MVADSISRLGEHVASGGHEVTKYFQVDLHPACKPFVVIHNPTMHPRFTPALTERERESSLSFPFNSGHSICMPLFIEMPLCKNADKLDLLSPVNAT